MPWIVKRLPQIPTDWLAFAAGVMIGIIFGLAMGWTIADRYPEPVRGSVPTTNQIRE